MARRDVQREVVSCLPCSLLCHTACHEGRCPTAFLLSALSASLAWVSCCWRVGGPGPPALLGTDPSLHGPPSCQAISLHSYLGGKAARGLSAGALWILPQTQAAPCHQLGRCLSLEDSRPLLFPVQPLPAMGLLRAPGLCGGHGPGSIVVLAQGGLGPACCLSLSRDPCRHLGGKAPMAGRRLARCPSMGTPAVEGWAPICPPGAPFQARPEAAADSPALSSATLGLLLCLAWAPAACGAAKVLVWCPPRGVSCPAPCISEAVRGCPDFMAGGGPAEPSRIGPWPPYVSWVSYVTTHLISELWGCLECSRFALNRGA